MLNRFRLVYKLRVENSRVLVICGRPSAAFVSAVRDIVALHSIASGEIECKGSGSQARLRFGAGFPERGRQAIRNVWSPPTAPGPGGGRRAKL